jgi:hypothetical protein
MLVESIIHIDKGKIHGGVPKQLGQYASPPKNGHEKGRPSDRPND